MLVGHSMGGVVVTQAAARCPDRVARLVYVAALPGDGDSLEGLTELPEGADVVELPVDHSPWLSATPDVVDALERWGA